MANFRARPHATDPAGRHDDRYPTDAEVLGIVDDSPTISALTTAVDGIARVSAYKHGVRANTGTDQSTALHDAFAEAESIGGGAVVELPPGVVTIDGSFSLNGYSSGMVGTGATTKVGAYGPGSGTILRAINQTGPVLDFTGFVYPRGMKGRVLFADFSIEGGGEVSPDNKGIYLGHASGASSVDLSRITISKTGGVPLHIENWY